jgi:tetratricopeptide (TPR) repeat protein
VIEKLRFMPGSKNKKVSKHRAGFFDAVSTGQFSLAKHLMIILFFSAIAFATYSNTLDAPFVLDDLKKIEKNPYIRIHQLAPREIIRAGLKSSKTRPIAFMTFALNYGFDQYDVFGYHIVNIVIHVLSGFFLYLFVATTLKLPAIESRYRQPNLIAFVAALIWLVHPIQTQSVTYIIQRINSLAALFFVLSFYLFVRGRLAGQPAKKWSWFGGAALSWVLALGCKQNAASLPVIIFFYEWYFFQDLSPKWFKSSLKYIIAVAVIFAAVAFLYLGTDPVGKISRLRDFSHGEFTLAERVLTQSRVVVYYLSLIFFPHPSRLNLDYDFPLSHSLFNPMTTLFSLILIIGLVALAVYLAKKERLISFCILWFFGNLVIESSIIPLAIIFEHRTYLPSMMVCLVPVLLADRFVRIDWLKIGLACMLVVVFSFWTFQRNEVWENQFSLWSDVVKKSPNKARPQLNLGISLSELGKTDGAITHYNKALLINPRYAKAHFNLGVALERQGKTVEAEKHYDEAIKNDPNYIEAHNNLGLLLSKTGRIEEALQHYRRILSVNPEYAQAYLNLGVALAESGKSTHAITRFEQALKIDPNFADAHYNLAVVLEKQGKMKEAIDHYSAALEQNPDKAEAHFNLGNIFFKQGHANDAVTHYKKALAIRPDFPEAIGNLALVNAARKDYSGALTLFLDLLKYRPDDAGTHYNIACMYSRLGQVDESIAWLKKAIDRGYHNWEAIKSDSDLDNIRNSVEYRKLIDVH